MSMENWVDIPEHQILYFQLKYKRHLIRGYLGWKFRTWSSEIFAKFSLLPIKWLDTHEWEWLAIYTHERVGYGINGTLKWNEVHRINNQLPNETTKQTQTEIYNRTTRVIIINRISNQNQIMDPNSICSNMSLVFKALHVRQKKTCPRKAVYLAYRYTSETASHIHNVRINCSSLL